MNIIRSGEVLNIMSSFSIYQHSFIRDVYSDSPGRENNVRQRVH